MLILLRRFIAVLLIIVFVPLFLVTMLLFRINDTALEASFYKEQLRKVDMYSFLLRDLPAIAVEENRDKLRDLPLGAVLTSEKIVPWIQRVLPPEWSQQQAERVLDQAVPYATGAADSFTITVPLKERADALLEVVNEVLRDADTYNYLLDEVITPAVEENIGDSSELPFGAVLTPEEVVSSIKRVLPQEWVQEQVDQVVAEVGPYLTGEADSFTITVPVKERAETALEVINEILRDADIYDFLFDEMIAPQVEESVGQFAELPLGVTITSEEAVSAVKQVVPQEWVQARVDDMIAGVGPYITGETDTFEIVVPLADRVEVALRVIEDLANRKLEALLAGLPQCTPEQLLRLAQGGLSTQVPECVPPGIDILEVKELFNIDFTTEIRQTIGNQIPGELRYTDADLRQMLAKAGNEEMADVLNTVREVISQGWTYTDADLRQTLIDTGNEDALDALDNVREVLGQGWTYTDADLRQDMAEGEGTTSVEDIDQARETLGMVRANLFLGYIALGVLLLIIGLLGGRGLWGKLRWAAVALILGAAVTLAVAIAVPRITTPLIQDRVNTLVANSDVEAQVSQAIADKLVEVVSNVSQGFWGPLQGKAEVYLIAGVLVLVGAILGNILSRRRRRIS